MSRVAVLALAAACSAPAAPRAAAVVAPPPAAAPATPPPAPIVHTDPGDGGIEAPPGGAIRMIAATPDGGAALTTDDFHGVRLWPTLDGSQEPRMVELPQARELALGRRGDGFTAAVLDPAGGLYIATLDAQGRSHSHVSLAADPAEYLGIAMATRGLVAWRADQSLALLDGDGAVLAHLGTEAGERIAGLAVSGERVAVLLDRDGKRGVRTVALAKPAWGAWIDIASEGADLIAMAPSGRIAVRDRDKVAVLEPTGKLVTNLARASGDSLAFVDDDHVAMSAGGKLVWLGAKPEGAGSVNAPVTAAGGRAISASNGDVMLATPTETHYLGYDVATPMVAQAIGGGQLALGYLAKLYTVDDRLRVVRALNMSVRDRAVELRWLGDDAWAVETGVNLGDDADFRLVTDGNARVIKNHLEAPCILGYEPTTHLLTLSLGDLPAVYRYDAAKHDLVLVAENPEISSYYQTELIPLRSGGQLLRVVMGSDTTIEWLPDAAQLAKPSAKVKITGSLAGADAAGNAYAWVSTATGMELAVYRAGKRVGSLPADGPVSVWPDPAGGRVVEIATHAVSLVTSDGKRAWSVPIEKATTALWLSDGAVALVTASGVARIDPATGKLTAVRCGWGFGLATSPHPTPPQIEPVCSQLEGAD